MVQDIVVYPSSEEHSITLPIVDPSLDTPYLPLVFNVLALYWGGDLTSFVSKDTESQYKNVRGSILIEGIELAEKHGFRSLMYKSSMKDLRRSIDQGIPIITILPGIRDLVQHATIVCGYNQQERRILTYVPVDKTQGAVPEKEFEKEWEEDDTTSIILIPSDMTEIVSNKEFKYSKSNRLCLTAERLRLQGNSEKAVEELSTAINVDSDNPHAWCALGSIYSDQGSEEAVDCFDRAIRLNKRYYLAYRGLGNFYLKNEEYEMADRWYTMAIQINPIRFAPIYKNRALARLKSDKDSVEEDLKKYLHYMPEAADKYSIEQAIKEL